MGKEGTSLGVRKSKLPDVGDRVIAIARGEGQDPFAVKSVRDNPFIRRPGKKPEPSSALIKDGATVKKEEALKAIGKRIVRVIASRYDATLLFADGSSLRLAEGGDGIEWLFSETPQPKKKP